MSKVKAALVVLLVAGAAGAGGYFVWKNSRPREIGICLVTDYAFRQRPNWEEVLASRVKETNRIFEPARIQWKVLQSSSVDPTSTYPGIDQRRDQLAETVQCPGGAVVSLSGLPEGKRGGSASPFSRSAVIVDFAQKSEAENAENMAHVLAYFFGAPQEPAGSGTVMTEPPEGPRFSDKSIALLRALRDYDLAAGVSAMTPDFDSRATAALTNAATGLPAKPAAAAHRIMAMAFANEHKMEQAVAHLREAVKADPQNALSHGELASGLMQRSETDEALKEIQEALRIEPNNAALHAAYAGILARTADPEGAIEEIRKSIQISPENPIFRTSLASIYLQEPGYIDEAISTYESTLKTAPNFRLAQIGLDRANGIKIKANEDVSNARKAVQQNASSGAYLALGLQETRAGNLDAATSALQRSVDMNPKNGRALVEMARLRFLKKDYRAAWAAVDQAKANNFETPATLVKALQRRDPR
jgi:Tfp pilus assembly protein PilF